MSEEPKNYLGQLTAPRAVRFERVFAAPVEEVWQYITSEKLLPSWIANASVDLRVGGRIKLHFSEDDADPEGYCKGEGVKDEDAGGTITVCEPNQRLTYLVLDPNGGVTTLSYTLVPMNGQTLLVLEHSDLPPDFMVAFAAGWHSYLDNLGCRLRGEEPQPLAPLFEANMKRYTFVLAVASVVLTSQAAFADASSGAYQAEMAERSKLLTKYDRLSREEDDLNRAISDLRRANSADAEKSLDYMEQDLKIKQDDLHKLELDIRDLNEAILVTPR
ncbi:MAG TPA: SRPBCC domain-containing protein [Trichormus sp.]|jgi:uncharacterized protein YndB with AHSA1/START domain